MTANLALLTNDSPRTEPERARVEVLTAGANRGARLMQPAFAEFNRASYRFTLSPVYADPVPERAALLAREAVQKGIPAAAIEARIEEVLPRKELRHAALIVSVDNPGAIASALSTVKLAERSALLYFLIRLPSNGLLGMRAVLQDGDEGARERGVRFFRKLADVTARSGAAAVLGEQGRAEHIALEPAYRRWFADHMQANLQKIVAHTRPENDAFEVTPDGRRTMMLMIHDSSSGWSDPSELARAVVEEPTAAIARGRDFMVAEIGPQGTRLHTVRVRAVDGRPALDAAVVVDADAYRAADLERRERARRELQEALERAERQTLTRTHPVFTTD